MSNKMADFNSSLGLGQINGPAVGIIMKETMRRVINLIRAQRQAFEVQAKQGYSGKMDDLCTSVDRAAQELYLRTIRECFPSAGVIAEEESLQIPCTNGCDSYFTIDPLDGTKAFVRGQSHGVGTMIALVQGGEVISAYVGDVNTKEIYGYRPGSEKVHRITEFSTSQHLHLEKSRPPLVDQYILLRDPERKYSKISQAFVARCSKNILVDGGSIGTWLSRLWKREVGAVLIPPAWETPWDSTPIIGISLKLGYKFFRSTGADSVNSLFVPWQPHLPKEKWENKEDILIVHEENIPEIRGYVTRNP